MKNILVIDVGTSSMRASMFDVSGSTLNTFRECYSPTFLSLGRAEQEPSTWKDSLLRLTRASVQWADGHGHSIDAIALTSQRSSAIPVGLDGEALHPAIMWQDTRTSGLCHAMNDHMERVYLKTGLRISPVLAAPKFAWFKREMPELYHRAHKLLTIADYLTFHITGRFVTDYTYGSRTLLMNIRTHAWDPDLLQLFGIDIEKLCELVPQGSVVGYSTDAFGLETGLPPNTPLISAGGDQQCSALGSGIRKPGSVQITTGTGSYVMASSEHAHLDPHLKMLCSVSAIPGHYIFEASILTTSAVYAWVGSTLYSGVSEGQHLLLRLGEDAAAAPPGSHGVLMLPHFQGRGSPDWNADARGVIANLTLATTRSDIVRAALEGIAAEIAENVDTLLRNSGCPESIVISGGLSNLPLFNQIVADMINVDVTVPHDRESTSMGAWVSAAVALGFYPSYADALKQVEKNHAHTGYRPIPENVQVYRQLHATLRTAYQAFCEVQQPEAQR